MGLVFDPQRRPLSQINVELLDDFTRTIGRTRTDNSGRYSFNRISAGRYRIRVLATGTGYQEQIQEVEITNFTRSSRTPNGNASVVSSSETIQSDFYLRLSAPDSKNVNTGSVFVQEVPENATKEYENALLDLNNKNFESGIEKLRKALNIYPEYYLALERLGQEEINLKNYQKATETLLKATNVNSRGYVGWYSLAYAYYSQKYLKEAANAAQTAVNLKPTVESQLLLGVVLREAKEYKESEKQMLKADKLADGKSADVHWNLSLLYVYNLKLFGKGANELEKFLNTKRGNKDSETIKKLIQQLKMVEQYLKSHPEIQNSEGFDKILQIIKRNSD